MSIEQEHNQKSAEERMQQRVAGTAHDERIAPQAPRGQEPGMPSSANSDASAGTGRMRRAVMAALAVLALAAACACGVFACTVGAQDPMLIEAGQQTDGDEGDNADANAAGADDSATGSSDAASDSDAGDKGAAASKNAKGEKAAKDRAAGESGKAASKSKAASNSSGSGSASSSQASGSGKANGSSSSSGSSKNNGGNGGSTSKGNSNSNASNKITVTMSIDGSRAGDQDSASMSTRKISVKRGANVYDVLVASGVSIQGDSTYVRSISGLAEFQCGGGSGWMYSVDGVFPNVSCGKYQLKGGERIVWAYTLNLGEDVK